MKEVFSVLSYRGYLRWIPSRTFLKLKYKMYTGKKLNLDNPRTFNEKLQWLKLYNADHFNPLYTKLADKVEAKPIVAEMIGEKYVIPTLGVWDRFDDIDFDSLPNQFVLKTNHDSGGVVIVKDKSKLDKAAAKQKLEKTRKINFYWYGREPQYKDIKPRIFAEQYISDGGYSLPDYKFHNSEGELEEYKIFCFSGKAKMVLVCKGTAHGAGRTNDYCDLELNRFPFTSLNPNSTEELQKPEQLDELICVAEKLAMDLPEVRIDLYVVDGKVYFGEMTFFHNSGFCTFKPDEWDTKLGKWINLPVTGGK